MSFARFDAITKALSFIDHDPPLYKDKFWEVRQMIHAWNWHMSDVFLAGWVSCLDKSMSIWTSRWTYPGFKFVPRKPHLVGNEYHSIADGLCDIMLGIEILEGEDKTKDRGKDKYHEYGKTGSLFLRLCTPLFMNGKVVILDSSFCVLLAVIALKKMGVFSSALIKKRKYLPRYVKGEEIKAHFEVAPVGDSQR